MMAQVDASIPLSYQPNVPAISPNTLIPLVQEAQERKQQNTLRQILSAPGAIDPATGLPTAQTIQAVTKVNPKVGTDLAVKGAEVKRDLQKGKQEEMSLYAPMIKEQKDAMVNILKPRVEKFGLEKAVEMSRADYKQVQKALIDSGVPEAMVAKMPQELTPALAQNFISAAISPKDVAAGEEKRIDDARKDKAAGLAERKEGETERKDDAVIAALNKKTAEGPAPKGWSEYQDDKGVTYRDNPNAGLTQKKVDGKWEDVDSLPKNVHKPGQEKAAFTPEMGELGAALAEQGVSLPAGMRSKEQQVNLYQGLLKRNPDKTPEEIASLVKTGKIELAAQLKETGTAAGIAGKVEVAQNELKQFIPLVSQASAKVPRGSWVPLNKLVQMADTSISDPALKQLKIYINSTLNAYDQLASRGGTDKDKRAAAHALLLSAEGPEALNAALEAFGKEAEAARIAAVKATKVPELEDADKKGAKKSDDGGWKIEEIK